MENKPRTLKMKELIQIIKLLNNSEKQTMLNALNETTNDFTESLTQFIYNNKSDNGFKCPFCGSVHVVKNGKRGNTQRFICRDCGKAFNSATNTIVSYFKHSFSTFEKYIDCMMNGMSIIKSAEKCNISKNTSFIWRHKILDALQNMASDVRLNGIVEADETFFPLSFKGSRVTYRKPRKRGGIRGKRGLSKELVCVPCAVNRNGLSIAKVSSLGKTSTKSIEAILNERIEKGSFLCTDRERSYIKFARESELNLIQLKNGKSSKKGIYNIQHINNYHSALKNFMVRFKGVATKYLNNYLIWNNFLNYSKGSYVEKSEILLSFVLTTAKRVVSGEISKRNPIPLAA